LLLRTPTRTLIPVVAAIALAVAASGAHAALADASSAPPATIVKIAIDDYASKPATVHVSPGASIIWTNDDDDPHTVTADDGSFDSKGLGQGDTYARTFAKPGTYAYHCAVHPFMKGVVIVGGSGS
jgi:plastocyanin